MNIPGTADRSDPNEISQRLTSIIRFHQLLSAELGPRVGLEPIECDDLIPVQLPMDPEKTPRVRSILDLHELMFGQGIVTDDPEAIRECGVLRRALAAHSPASPGPTRIVPANLGRSVLRLGIAVPLFGPHQPGYMPPSTSAVLLRRDRLPAEIQILVFDFDQSVDVQADGLGFRMNASSPRVRVSYLPDSVPLETEWETTASRVERLAAGAALTVSVAREPAIDVSIRSGPEQGDYLFAFPSQPRLRSSLVRYLSRLHSGRFQIPQRRAEDLSSWVVERVLG
jgi:hypothetical protein